jgi:hypothetical protein
MGSGSRPEGLTVIELPPGVLNSVFLALIFAAHLKRNAKLKSLR